jgi:hypothetical protein
MFNLEKAIAAWRNSLEYHRTFLHKDLDELERHVRDQIRGLLDRGDSEDEAFSRALADLGNVGIIEREYEKVYWGKVKRAKTFSSELIWRISMLKNYWKIAIRSLWKHKGTSLINISGLAIGMACCIVVFLFVKDETSFDAYHELRSTGFHAIARTQLRPGTRGRPAA